MKIFLLFAIGLISPFCHAAEIGRLSRSSSVSSISPKLEASTKRDRRLTESLELRVNTNDAMEEKTIVAKERKAIAIKELKTFLRQNEFCNLLDSADVGEKQVEIFSRYFDFLLPTSRYKVTMEAFLNRVSSFINEQLAKSKEESDKEQFKHWVKYSRDFIKEVEALNLASKEECDDFINNIDDKESNIMQLRKFLQNHSICKILSYKHTDSQQSKVIANSFRNIRKNVHNGEPAILTEFLQEVASFINDQLQISIKDCQTTMAIMWLSYAKEVLEEVQRLELSSKQEAQDFLKTIETVHLKMQIISQPLTDKYNNLGLGEYWPLISSAPKKR